MSLIDPGTRWWNRDVFRQAGAYGCWTVAILLTLAGMCSLMAEGVSSLPMWFGLLANVLPIPMLIGGVFLIVFGNEDREDFDSRIIVLPLAGYFIANGTGALIGASMSPQGVNAGHAVFVVFAVGGAVVIAVAEVLRHRSRRSARMRAFATRTGVAATGVVTQARGYSVNHHPVTRVTVRFTDAQGRSRRASSSVRGTVGAGEEMRVRFSPDHLGRKGTAVLSRAWK